jgi:hypothetical protein
MLPEMTAEPVAVIAVPPRAAKLSAAPSGGTPWANADRDETAIKSVISNNVAKENLSVRITDCIDISPA